MAEGGKSAKAVFKEAVPELITILGREPPFTIVTAKLNAEDLITDSELSAIRRQGLTNDERGNEVAEKLKNKIKGSKDPNGCLLKICDVFESKTVDYPTLKEYGAKMRKSISNTVSTVTVQPNGSDTTMATKSKNDLHHVLTIKDLDDINTVLVDEAMFGPVKWNDLGLKLGLFQPRLNAIKAEGGDAFQLLKKTIEVWLEGKDKKTSRTWQTLIDAVKRAGDRAAAERISEILKSR